VLRIVQGAVVGVAVGGAGALMVLRSRRRGRRLSEQD